MIRAIEGLDGSDESNGVAESPPNPILEHGERDTAGGGEGREYRVQVTSRKERIADESKEENGERGPQNQALWVAPRDESEADDDESDEPIAETLLGKKAYVVE